mmetsp:Transcript_123771/g.240874  ORF Transcript_123771/g.240874 Transcript_123771/m.240874 type:complete len:230 (+) Transcript_123771:464-1153(+)
MHPVVLELALVGNAVRRPIDSSPMFFALQIFAVVAGSVWPAFRPSTRFVVLVPLALENRTVCFSVSALALCTILVPLALINVSVCCCKLAMTVGLPSSKIPLITPTIRLLEHTLALTHRSPPLACVSCACLHISRRLPFKICIVVIIVGLVHLLHICCVTRQVPRHEIPEPLATAGCLTERVAATACEGIDEAFEYAWYVFTHRCCGVPRLMHLPMHAHWGTLDLEDMA